MESEKIRSEKGRIFLLLKKEKAMVEYPVRIGRQIKKVIWSMIYLVNSDRTLSRAGEILSMSVQSVYNLLECRKYNFEGGFYLHGRYSDKNIPVHGW